MKTRKTTGPKNYHLFRMDRSAPEGSVRIGDYETWEQAEAAQEAARSERPAHYEITIC